MEIHASFSSFPRVSMQSVPVEDRNTGETQMQEVPVTTYSEERRFCYVEGQKVSQRLTDDEALKRYAEISGERTGDLAEESEQLEYALVRAGLITDPNPFDEAIGTLAANLRVETAERLKQPVA